MTDIDLAAVHLGKGAHNTADDGLCLLEAVAYFADRPHTDAPPCVSPVLRNFGINLNDVLPDEQRQELKRFIPLLPGTAGDGQDEARSYLALDWLIRTYTPVWLDLAGLSDGAASLRSLGQIVNLTSARAAGPVMRAAGVAAGDAAWDALKATKIDLQAAVGPLIERMCALTDADI